MTIVIKKASSGVAVMRLIGDADAATCVEQWKASNPGEYVTHATVAEEALPLDRASRAKWALVDGAVVIDEAMTPVPQEVTMAAARVVLLRHGYDDAAIRGAIAASSMTQAQKAEALIEWEFRTTVRRQSPLTLALAAILGLAPEAANAMFIEAGEM